MSSELAVAICMRPLSQEQLAATARVTAAGPGRQSAEPGRDDGHASRGRAGPVSQPDKLY